MMEQILKKIATHILQAQSKLKFKKIRRKMNLFIIIKKVNYKKTLWLLTRPHIT